MKKQPLALIGLMLAIAPLANAKKDDGNTYYYNIKVDKSYKLEADEQLIFQTGNPVDQWIGVKIENIPENKPKSFKTKFSPGNGVYIGNLEKNNEFRPLIDSVATCKVTGTQSIKKPTAMIKVSKIGSVSCTVDWQ